MKAVDLHIHTISTPSDSSFEFSMETLKEYVGNMELDIIGITNHNTFDLEQFKKIDEEVEAKVLPGIEINFEGGHLLILSENEDLDDFSYKCKEVESRIKTVHDSLTKEGLFDIFQDLRKYLLIPHHPKRPKVPIQVIKSLSNFINAIEVSSVKDFKREHKDNKEFVPLWFSDIRISERLEHTKRGRTFFNIEESDINSIKLALLDREKVQLSIEESTQLFPIDNYGLEISTGLNILMGARSSGKSHFLNEVNDNHKNAKYIKQFSLLDKQDSSTKEFNVRLSNENSLIGEKRFSEFKELIEDVSNVDIEQGKKKIDEYIDSLIKFASEEERRDSFSKAKLFTQDKFVIKEMKIIDQLISSIEILIQNKEYEEIIGKHLKISSLKNLIVELSRRAINLNKDIFIKKQVNQLIEEVKISLEVRSSSNKIEDVDFKTYLTSTDKIKKFNYICNLVKKEKVFEIEKIGKFNLVMKTQAYNNVSEIKECVGGRMPLAAMFKASYHTGYTYLQELKKLDISTTDYYKYFVNIKYDIINEYNLPASGGERAEYNLLNEIKSASNYDILLIDEPESSFDNIFLNKEVNDMIKIFQKNSYYISYA